MTVFLPFVCCIRESLIHSNATIPSHGSIRRCGRGEGYLVISNHALERMDERKIPVSVIIATYENPDMVLPNADHLNARNHVWRFSPSLG
jgi:hypothetical protein